MANTEPTIPAKATKGFVDTFSSVEAAYLARVNAVGAAFEASKVGQPGGASQNATLKALEAAIGAALGADANIRNGWKFGNLGNYARVYRAITKLEIKPTVDTVSMLYAVQNALRDSFGDYLDKVAGIPAAQRAAQLVTIGRGMLDQDAKARAVALANRPKRVGKQTPAAFVASFAERLRGRNFTSEELAVVSTELTKLVAKLAKPTRSKPAAKPEPVSVGTLVATVVEPE